LNNKATGGNGADGGNSFGTSPYKSRPDGGDGGDAKGGGLYRGGGTILLTNTLIAQDGIHVSPAAPAGQLRRSTGAIPYSQMPRCIAE
jgi:hypothetical protein